MDSGFQNDCDNNYDWGDGAEFEEFDISNNGRDARYRDAYGDYSGGYGHAGAMGYPISLRPPPPPSYGQPPRGPPLGFGPPPLFPPRPSGAPRMLRGYGAEPPMRMRFREDEDKASKFLMKCGLTREAVKKIPKEILVLMEPQHCGLCSFSLNSFSLSRIHYNSKAHANAQKKWIVQKSVMGTQGKKEVPFKARELYCELCDVQITSKPHGDSHYAGKPHRAIVEGRKAAKNPMLLQRGFEKRLEQLIRREKKFLTKKAETENADDGEAKKEPKPIIPALYCAICKTAVTCTEQMTMHMNGKKHLTKEKQHILNMMRAGNDNNDNTDNAEGGPAEEYEGAPTDEYGVEEEGGGFEEGIHAQDY